MREAHAHIAGFGEALSVPDLSACRSVGECLDAVARAAAAKRAQGSCWVRFHGARIAGWDERRWPTITELDQAAGETPCIIRSFDHHAACANTRALAAAGLRPGQVVAPKGLVGADPLTGQATGELIEHAAVAVWEAGPEPSLAQRSEQVLSALNALAGHGYQEVHDLHSQDWLGSVLSDLERAGRLPVRSVWLYPPVSRVEAVHAGRRSWESACIRLAGGKLFADGTLNSRTALMLDPYRDPLPDHPCGRAMLSPGELDESVRLCERLGLHVAVHAIGDGAVRMVLDSIERTGTPRGRGNQHRIEHCEIIDRLDVPRFAQLGVVCSVQPCHLLADVEVLADQLPHRLDRVLPLRDLIASGCSPTGADALLWFGSDVPVVRPDHEDTIQAAVHRRRRGAPEKEAIGWDQRIEKPAALAAFGVRAMSAAARPRQST